LGILLHFSHLTEPLLGGILGGSEIFVPVIASVWITATVALFIALLLMFLAYLNVQRSVQESEKKHRLQAQSIDQLIEDVLGPIILCETDGQIVRVNQAMALLSGYSRSELRAMNFNDLVTMESDLATPLQTQTIDRVIKAQLKRQRGDAVRIQFDSCQVLYEGRSLELNHLTDLESLAASAERRAQRERILQGVRDASDLLLRSTNWRQSLEEVLPELGNILEVPQVSLRRRSEIEQIESLFLDTRWHIEGGITNGTPSFEEGRRWDPESAPDFWSLFEGSNVLHTKTSNLTGVSREAMELEDVYSFAASSILVGHKPWGILLLEDTTGSLDLRNAQIDGLNTFSHVMGACIERQLSTERLKLSQESLRQAQKMEAIGHLAGGIAHDFNNLLASILGFSRLIDEDLGSEHPNAPDISAVISAGERGQNLVRQLMIFSRRREIQRGQLDLSALIKDFQTLLRRTLGSSIELFLNTEDDLSAIEADSGQIEQILMNLCVNARDAMPEGGRIEIKTRMTELDEDFCASHYDLNPGPYVMLSVKDDGSGIPKEIRAKIFEPFFTTKEAGKGTGLGLSNVFNIVKESSGYIDLLSEPEAGTEFKLYFPALATKLDQKVAGEDTQVILPVGDETILVVDDDASVLNLALRQLNSLGYNTISARNGEEGLSLYAEHHNDIHLVLTDVIMPKMSGVAMVSSLRETYGDTFKVIYISGYTQNEFHESRGELSGDTSIIHKPYTKKALAYRIREELS